MDNYYYIDSKNGLKPHNTQYNGKMKQTGNFNTPGSGWTNKKVCCSNNNSCKCYVGKK